jgi:hypothetical protein
VRAGRGRREDRTQSGQQHRVFTAEEGTLLYRQLDNFSLKHRVMFDWLDEVLEQR